MATILKGRNAVTCDHICELVGELVAARLGIHTTQIADHADLRDELGADALDIAEILFALGRMHQPKLPTLRFQGMTTIDGIRTLEQLLSICMSP